MAETRNPIPFRGPWLALMVLLSTAPTLKLGDIQVLELVQTASLLAALLYWAYGGFRIPWGGLWRRYGVPYLAFLAVALILSLLAFRLPFYPPPGIPWIKRPGFLSLSRIFEWFLVIYFMIVAAESARKKPALFNALSGVYVSAAVIAAAASILALVWTEISGGSSWLVFGPDRRIRGLFNEGGPFGIFLVSAGVVALLRARYAKPVHGWVTAATVFIVLVGLLLSGSKAGMIAAILLCAAALLSGASIRHKLVLLFAMTLLAVVFSVKLGPKMYGYFYAFLNLDEVLDFRPEDPSVVMGRLAATVIVPRMILAHPFTGIGAGNYSLMRNDPFYLDVLPPVDEWDLHGTGLFGTVAELGVPLTVFLLAVLLRPAVCAWRRRAPTVVTVAALFQPVAFLLGVNLNFFYPWLVAALVLALEPSVTISARKPLSAERGQQ